MDDVLQSASAEKKVSATTFCWLVVFQNVNIKDEKKKKLYVLLKDTGDYIAANFTGK